MAKTTLPLWLLKNPEQAKLLRQVAEPVSLPDIEGDDFQELIEKMAMTMYQANGIGLAAPQIGQSIRLAVVDGHVNDHNEPYVLINPVLLSTRTEEGQLEEGCLSIPKVYGLVWRPKQVVITAFDRRGQPRRYEASDLFARVLQHELDHLNGRVFTDRAEKITQGHLPI